MSKGISLFSVHTPQAVEALVAVIAAAQKVFGPLDLGREVTIEPLYGDDFIVSTEVETNEGVTVTKQIRIAVGKVVRFRRGFDGPYQEAESLEAALRLILP